MRSGDLLSEGIIYVREGVGAGVAPTEQVAEQVERAVGRGVELYVRVRVCVRVGDKTKPDQARPNPLYDI